MKNPTQARSSRFRVSRRQFLGVATAAAGTMALPASAADDRPTSRLTVGFLGTGYSHFAAKYRLLRQSPDFQVVGLCEPDDAIRLRGPTDARWLTREELFGAAEVIVVEGAVKDHARDARLALMASRHVHVEKPPADSLAALEELLQLAAQKKRLLQIGYMWRYHPGLNAALAAARAGWLGEVYLVRGTINTQVEADRRREWAQFRGGVMFELGCHLVDPLIRLLDRPEKVHPTLQHAGGDDDGLADNTVAVFGFARALGVLTCAALQPGAGPNRSFEVLGTNGSARVQPLEPATLVVDLAKAAGPYLQGRQEVPLPPYERYLAEFVALAHSIRTGQPLPVSAEEEQTIQSALMQACGMG